MSSLTDKDPARIAGMFDAIAATYDRLNHLLSGGLDRRWRLRAVRELRLTGRERLLDMCTGTADLAIAAVTGNASARAVVGIDFAGAMLRIGRAKVERAGLSDRIFLARGDAMRVPLADGSVDRASVAFGIRNVADPARACAEFHRVLAPGGRLAVLEFTEPTLPGWRALYRWYFRAVLPRVGALISRHGDAYRYLPASVGQFPPPDVFLDVLRHAGFAPVRYIPLTLGTVGLYLADR